MQLGGTLSSYFDNQIFTHTLKIISFAILEDVVDDYNRENHSPQMNIIEHQSKSEWLKTDNLTHYEMAKILVWFKLKQIADDILKCI